MKRILRRREPGRPPRRGVVSLFRGRSSRARRLPGYRRMPSFTLPRLLKRWPWSAPPAPAAGATQETGVIVAEPPPPSFKERGRLRRRLRFLRRARELGFRDIGGLIFDMRRFERNRPDLLDAKLDALLAVDRELRALERLLDDRRPFHVLREPGISSCARCGALHASEANFCPQCGLQFAGPRAMGEVGGAISAPPQPPPPPGAAAAPAAPAQQEWAWPAPESAADQPTAPTIPEPVAEDLTVAYVPALRHEAAEGHAPSDSQAPRVPDAGGAEQDDAAEPAQGPGVATDADTSADDDSPPPPPAAKPAAKKPAKRRSSTSDDQRPLPADEQQAQTHVPPRAPGGS